LGDMFDGFAGLGGAVGRGGTAVRLPPRRSSFVGRAVELDEIVVRLRRYAMVTLVGVGGVGKTALAVEAAWIEVLTDRVATAFFVDLVPCRTDDQVVAAMVEAVGIRGAGAAAGLDAVVDALEGRSTLMVVDNCEHVLAAARQVCDRLAGRVAGLRLLVTSRAPLDVEAECVWRVPPMAVLDDDGGSPVASDAVALFFARAAMAGVTLESGPAAVAMAGSICRGAGGLPLAIELVANRLRVASLTELAAGLGRSGWPARSGGAGRHDSLDACLGWSHGLLSPDARVVFRRLSVFPAGFDLAAADQVAGTEPVEGGRVAGLVEQLVTASLLEADTAGTWTRFRFSEPVRQYAAARLVDAGEEELVGWRHARFYLVRAESIEPSLFEAQAEHHFDLLELDRPDHEAALGWFLASGAVEDGQRLAAALYFFWYTRGLFVTGLRWLRAALAAEGEVESLVRLRTEVALAQLAFIAGDYVASFAAVEAAVPAARLLGDDVVLGRCLATAGYVWWFLDPERSAALFEEGLTAAHRSGDDFARSIGLAGLGWARYFADRVDEALGSLNDVIQMTARSGRRQQFAMAVLGRAALELRSGQLGAADASAHHALGALQAVGDATWTSAALAVVAEIERTRGRLDTAERDATEAIEVAERAGSAINVMLATGHLGRILLARGGPAAALLEDAVQRARAFGVRPLLAWWLDSLGELAELEGRSHDAQGWYGQALGHAADSGLAVDAARARHHLARLAWTTGDRAAAINGCHDALSEQLAANDRLGLVETLETLGGVLVDERRADRGLPLLAAATVAREVLGFPRRPVEVERIGGWVATGRDQLGAQAQPTWERGTRLSPEEAAGVARRGRGPRRRPALGWDSLTPAERNVADLVAHGRSNPEIAAQLGVSAGTVKDQVSSALRKLGIRTRAELAAAVSSHAAI
jgi:predicted ATPase/DNA-binding CsgD family transcriptional regulator